MSLAAPQQVSLWRSNTNPDFTVSFRRFAGDKDKTMFTPIIRFIQRWKRYGVDVQALSSLSDRELADMGINRCDIHRIAGGQSR
jgi:uncharacterized protein YjiS (DUF1127 family)